MRYETTLFWKGNKKNHNTVSNPRFWTPPQLTITLSLLVDSLAGGWSTARTNEIQQLWIYCRTEMRRKGTSISLHAMFNHCMMRKDLPAPQVTAAVVQLHWALAPRRGRRRQESRHGKGQQPSRCHMEKPYVHIPNKEQAAETWEVFPRQQRYRKRTRYVFDTTRKRISQVVSIKADAYTYKTLYIFLHIFRKY